jgi:hypothetical protein
MDRVQPRSLPARSTTLIRLAKPQWTSVSQPGAMTAMPLNSAGLPAEKQ